MKVKTLILLLLLAGTAFGQKEYAVTFEELSLKMMEHPKPIVIKIYTDWCGVCKIQDKQIEKDAELQQMLAKDFYYIEFNAETRADILYNNKMYRFIPHGTKGGVHELALALGGKQLSYPCWIIIAPGYQVITTYNGLLKSRELKNNLLQYKN
jgi:hypothetical protein